MSARIYTDPDEGAELFISPHFDAEYTPRFAYGPPRLTKSEQARLVGTLKRFTQTQKLIDTNVLQRDIVSALRDGRYLPCRGCTRSPITVSESNTCRARI